MRTLIAFLIITLVILNSCEKNNVDPGVESTEIEIRISEITNSDIDVYNAKIAPDNLTIVYSFNGNELFEYHSINYDGNDHAKIISSTRYLEGLPAITKDLLKISFTTISFIQSTSIDMIFAHFNGDGYDTLFFESEEVNPLYFVEEGNFLFFNKRYKFNGCMCNSIWKMDVRTYESHQISDMNSANLQAYHRFSDKLLVKSQYDYYLIDGNGENRYNLPEGVDYWTISEDGNKIAGWKSFKEFDESKQQDVKFREIVIFSINDELLEQVTSLRKFCQPLSFSPDGKRLLVNIGDDNIGLQTGEESELYEMDIDGGNMLQLTDNEFYEEGLGYVNRGEGIVYLSNGTLYLIEKQAIH